MLVLVVSFDAGTFRQKCQTDITLDSGVVVTAAHKHDQVFLDVLRGGYGGLRVGWRRENYKIRIRWR